MKKHIRLIAALLTALTVISNLSALFSSCGEENTEIYGSSDSTTGAPGTTLPDNTTSVEASGTETAAPESTKEPAEETTNVEQTTSAEETTEEVTTAAPETTEHVHSYELSVEKEATCIEVGTLLYTCACGYVRKDTIPVTDHKNENGKCIVCGYEDITGIRGLKMALQYQKNAYDIKGIGTCTLADLVLPSTHNDLPVKEIGAYAFRGCTFIKSVTISENIWIVYDQAFENCTSLTDIYISKSLSVIQEGAFRGCNAVKNITIDPENKNFRFVDGCLIDIEDKKLLFAIEGARIPDDGSVTSIGMYAFQNSTWLKSIEIPASVKRIESGAFEKCTALESVILHEGLEDISWFAFRECQSLKSISIPDSVTKIGYQVFEKCSSLTDVKLSKNITEIPLGFFQECTSLINIEIPEGVVSIGNYAFKKCESLKSVSLPKSFIEMDKNPFDGCSSLEKITLAEGNAVYAAINNCLVRKADKVLVVGCKTSVIPTDGSVTAIGEGAFAGNAQLTKVIIPDCITSVGKDAFRLSNNIIEMSIGNGVTSLEGFSFSYNMTLETLTIGSGITEIPDAAFEYCIALETLNLTNSIKKIGEKAFYSCIKLSTINFAGTVAEWNAIEMPNTSGANAYRFTVNCIDGVVDYSKNQ
ncbi:MAG: leucine-rich repeat protein [Clostridia bacterium]|nr:leucine-rich repeat protein [Clostridia bacterium]